MADAPRLRRIRSRLMAAVRTTATLPALRAAVIELAADLPADSSPDSQADTVRTGAPRVE